MIKAITTACMLALGTATAFASTKAPLASGRAGSVQSAKFDAMNANAKMKKGRVTRAAAPSSATANNGQSNNWFGSPNNRSTKTNSDWFGGEADTSTRKGKTSTSATTNNGFDNDWFGGSANNVGAKGTGTARKGKMAKSQRNE
jgi:hypothetical protein